MDASQYLSNIDTTHNNNPMLARCKCISAAIYAPQGTQAQHIYQLFSASGKGLIKTRIMFSEIIIETSRFCSTKFNFQGILSSFINVGGEGCPFAPLRFPAKSDQFTKRPQKMGADCFPIAGNLFPFPNLRRLAINNNYHTFQFCL